jgi:hypothetical protein
MFTEELEKFLDRFKAITARDLSRKGSMCCTPECKHSIWAAGQVYADGVHVSGETKLAPLQTRV